MFIKTFVFIREIYDVDRNAEIDSENEVNQTILNYATTHYLKEVKRSTTTAISPRYGNQEFTVMTIIVTSEFEFDLRKTDIDKDLSDEFM